VHSDVEDVYGTMGNDILEGNSASNLLDGFEGNDSVKGGGSIDVLFGSAGNDSLDARDGLGERVDCGAGTDTATIDDTDTTSACETIDSSGALIDADGDGSPRSVDCNDANNQIKPGAVDVPDNGIDENCDGADAVDLDRDRDGSNRPQDCNDADAKIKPGAVDIPGNKVDEDCSGADARLPKLKTGVSFTVIRVGTKSVFTKLTLTGVKAGDKVKLSCPTRGCKIRSKTIKAAKKGKLALVKYAGAALGPASVVKIVVSRKGFASLTIRLTMGAAGKAPKVKKT
jgi:hypothetical protein